MFSSFFSLDFHGSVRYVSFDIVRYPFALKAKYYSYNATYWILGLIRLDTVHWVTSISLGHSRYPSQETQDYSGYLLRTNVAYRSYQA